MKCHTLLISQCLSSHFFFLCRTSAPATPSNLAILAHIVAIVICPVLAAEVICIVFISENPVAAQIYPPVVRKSTAADVLVPALSSYLAVTT